MISKRKTHSRRPASELIASKSQVRFRFSPSSRTNVGTNQDREHPLSGNQQFETRGKGFVKSLESSGGLAIANGPGCILWAGRRCCACS